MSMSMFFLILMSCHLITRLVTSQPSNYYQVVREVVKGANYPVLWWTRLQAREKIPFLSFINLLEAF